MRRFVVTMVVCSVVVLGGTSLVPTVAGAAGPDLPAEDARRGVVNAGLRPAAAGGPCQGGFEIAGNGNGRKHCTHGPDPAPVGIDVKVDRAPAVAAEAAAADAAADATATETPPAPVTAAATTVPCYGDGTSGPRVQLLYARASDRPDRYASLLPTFQQLATQIDDVFMASAAETGGVRHVRYVTDASCSPVVANVVLSTTGDDNIDSTIFDLVARGYSRSDRKYLVWVDANVYCGIAEIYNDDRPSPDNYNNGNPAVEGMVARVDNGCWGLGGRLVEAHELMHTLGGVQTSAPRATSMNHCVDDYDRMCYADGSGRPMVVACPAAAHEALFDCNHDDYFTTARLGPTQYLATRWNTAKSAFLATAGSVSAWGYNGFAELGDGTLTSSFTPVQVPNLAGVTAVSAGYDHSLALRPDGTVVAWGANGYGQLGDGTTTTRVSPVVVPGLTGVTSITAGAFTSYAVRSDGTIWSWGFNALGGLGDGTLVDRRTPVRVAGLTGMTSVATGLLHSVALRSDGTVFAWGWNGAGQLGDSTTTDRWTAVAVPGMTGVTSVAAGMYHSVGSRTDGTVWAWGGNGFGQLGDGTTADRRTPGKVTGLSDVASVVAGYDHNLSLSRTGAVHAWGWNGVGQLGDGTIVDRRVPTAVVGMTSGVVSVAAGAYHSHAIDRAGQVFSWGWNYFGMLGDGTTTQRNVATRVGGPLTATRVSGGGIHSLTA